MFNVIHDGCSKTCWYHVSARRQSSAFWQDTPKLVVAFHIVLQSFALVALVEQTHLARWQARAVPPRIGGGISSPTADAAQPAPSPHGTRRGFARAGQILLKSPDLLSAKASACAISCLVDQQPRLWSNAGSTRGIKVASEVYGELAKYLVILVQPSLRVSENFKTEKLRSFCKRRAVSGTGPCHLVLLYCCAPAPPAVTVS